MTGSDLQRMSDRLRDRIVGRFDLTEVGAPSAVLTLASSGERVGEVRTWTGPAVPKLVDARLVVPELGLDSSMLHAFAPTGSASPHLASDVIGLGDRVSVNADLTPRVDLAVAPAYLDEVYPPLTAAREALLTVADAAPVDLPLRLLAFTSPWMTGASLPASRLDAVEAAAAAYADRFGALIETPPKVGADADELAVRDRAARRAQFDPASDEVWDFLADLVGRESVDAILALVQDPGSPTAP